jgi:serine/threonine-protein kinase
VPDRDNDLLDKLLASVADGDSIDWERIGTLPADEKLRHLLGQLRIVADVAKLHRASDADVAVETVQASGVGVRTVAGPALGQWGHLHLVRKVGEGSFGEVYHAHDTWLDHPVALKLIRPQVASEFSTRIVQEARKLARVRHPNVVTVHGADSHDGRTGFWMDLVDGETLADLMARGRLSAGEAAHIGQEVCRALAAMHQVNLVHRDVKAQNVMRASDGGRIILMDFGAGEFIGDRSAASGRQGTPLYLAPELLSGGPASVRSDIYALGVLLYYLVTASFPVQARGGSLSALRLAHLRGERRRLHDARPDLPAAFVSIVERAIDPKPERRFASAGDMYAALAEEQPHAAAAPVAVAAPATPAERTALQRLGRVGAVSVAAVCVTGALGLLATRWFEVTLRIDPDFISGPAGYFLVGLQALIPFGIYWTVFGAALGLLAGVRLLLPRSVEAVWSRIALWPERSDPNAVAMVVFLAGSACWLGLTWAYFDLFAALEALSTGPSTTADLSILGPAARSVHRNHGGLSAALGFVLGLAAWRWFPRLERQVADASTVRLLRWATLAVLFLVLATAVLPRRFVWERFEVVTFENQRAVVVGRNSGELLLYNVGERRHRRVRSDDPALSRIGTTMTLFEQAAGRN